MPFKLVVVQTPDGPSDTPDAYVFNQERVTIGRDAQNDLHLPDFKRVVSKNHAEITQAVSGFHLTDLGSKNFTYLNGDRLQANQPYPIRPGDSLQVGEYEIELEAVETVAPPAPSFEQNLDMTVFDASFVNPFEEGVTLLAAALRDLGEHYERMPAQRRDSALQEAMQDRLDDRGIDALEAIARTVRGDTPPVAPTPAEWPSAGSPFPDAPFSDAPFSDAPFSDAPFSDAPFSDAPFPDAAPPEPLHAEWPPVEWPSTGRAASPPSASAMEPLSGRAEQLLDITLRVVSRLIGAPWRFRHEFIGQTVMQSEDSMFLQESDPVQLKQHMLDPSVPEDLSRQRMQRLEMAGDEVALHMIALLDGYKAGVKAGAKRLIDQLHPEAMVEEAAGHGALNRLVPALAKAAALDRMQERLRELRQEDWSAAEPRAYRPAFIKAYLARMTAPRPRTDFD